MTLHLERITIPAGSTIGYGRGIDEHGNVVRFAGDWRPLRDLGEVLAAATGPIEADVSDWQVLSVEELPGR
jgi:hypothetical protein